MKDYRTPRISTMWNAPYFSTSVSCRVCGKRLAAASNFFEKKSIDEAVNSCPNFCPKCGTKLKENISK